MDDINEEIDATEKKVENMKKLEDEMDNAIDRDAKRNSKLIARESGVLKNMQGAKGLAGLAELDEEEDDEDAGEFVKVNKQDLLTLKAQLDELAKNMQIKKEKAKKRNQDLMAFVDKLQSEQKDLLNNLDSKIAKRKSVN